MTDHDRRADPEEVDRQVEEAAVRAAQGDSAAFVTLRERCNSYAERVAFQVLKNQEDAEDVAQNVWIKLWPGIRKYKPEASFTTWFYRVVTNSARDYRRRLRRDRDEPLDSIAQGSYAPGQEMEHLQRRIKEEFNVALKGLRVMNSKRAQCFEMHYLNEMSVNEISAELGIPVGTVKSHLFLGRKYIEEKHPVLSDLNSALQETLGKAS